MNNKSAQLPDMLEKMLPIAMHILRIDKLPRIKLLKELKEKHQPSFGCYVQEENVIYLAINNRHPVDIMRTLAHELTHFKQNTNNELDDKSGMTGSHAENEANAIAGIIIRHLNKQHSEFLEAGNINLS